uniref:Uncharacterized protein n=1 Tax=Rhizophagus irregularis (strain DAOM 181602 / DAOM 197198 / MUCL 43194) TaxID=747089 RepID=U9U5J4_RHIID
MNYSVANRLLYLVILASSHRFLIFLCMLIPRNSKEQQEFRNILLRMCNRESTINDWKILTTQIEDKIGITDRPTITNLEGKRVVPIALIKRTWTGLTLNKAVIDLSYKDFERLQRIKDGKRLLKKVDEEKCLVFMVPRN